MYNLSNLISLPVISIYESKSIGIVHNLLFSNKTNRCVYLEIVSNDDIKYILDYKDIKSIGSDSITISNCQKLSLIENEEYRLKSLSNPVNADIYDIAGNKIDKVCDITLDKHLKIENIILDSNKTIPLSHIVSFSDSVVIYSKNKVSIKSYKPRTKIPTTKSPVVEVKIEKPTYTTQKLTDQKTLLGRVVTKDITLPNGEILVKLGSTISQDTIRQLSKYGKIVELTRYSESR